MSWYLNIPGEGARYGRYAKVSQNGHGWKHKPVAAATAYTTYAEAVAALAQIGTRDAATARIVENNNRTLELDFVNNVSYIAGTVANSTSPLTVSRASTGYAEDTSGVWTSFATNTARRTNKGLLIETARTNSLRNNSMQGAVAGTPGTLPTNWAVALNGVSSQVVGTGTENGLDYIDLRIFGTTTNTSMFQFRVELNNNIAALNGQTWSGSLFHKLIDGTLNNISAFVLQVFENNAAGTALANSSQNFVPTSTMQRVTLSRAFNQATTAFANLKFSVSNTSGVEVDVTFRIYMPQLELGAFVTSPIRTTTVAVTRATDIVSLPISATWFSQLTGTALFEGIIPITQVTNNGFWCISDGTTGNEIFCYGNSGRVSNHQVDVASVNQCNVQKASAYSVNATFKDAFAWKVNDFQGYTNGAATGADVVGTVPGACTELRLGVRAGNSFPLDGYIRSFAYYPARLPNATLQALTL